MRRIETLLLATGNPGKLRELRARLTDDDIEVIGLDDLEERPGEVAETGETFADNAVLKAVGYGQIAGLPTMADDSGLEVDALDGAPGVYSARFAGPEASDEGNNALLLERLEGASDRRARFRCTIALYLPPPINPSELRIDLAGYPDLAWRDADDGGAVILAEGKAEGTVLSAPQGEEGFGYDPLFLSDDLGKTFAQASVAEKGAVSHRGRALTAILPYLRRRG